MAMKMRPVKQEVKTQMPKDREKQFGTRFMVGGAIRAVEGDGNERTFTLSFSSEDPYQRWYDATEILSHVRKRETRLRRGQSGDK